MEFNKQSEKETRIVKHGVGQLWSYREKPKMKRIVTAAGRTMIQQMENGKEYYVELAEEKQDMEEELAAASEQRNENQRVLELAFDMDWEGIFVYGYPDYKRRKELWKELTFENNNLDVPMAFIGDFNDVIAQHEKITMLSWTWSYKGQNTYGFSNPRNGFVTKERIDRVIANWEWRRAFQHATLSALPTINSDHTPLVLNVKPRGIRSRCFKFEAFWADHADCGNVIRRGWNNVCNSTVNHWTNSTRRMNNCKQKLIKWSKVNFKRDFLLRNRRWSIGNGEKVRILEDNWILNIQRSPQVSNNDVTFVKELITEGQRWNINELRKHFDGDTLGKIIRTLVSVIGREDKFCWPLKTNKKYTIKTGYHNQSPLSMRCCFALGQGPRGFELKFSAVLRLIRSHLLENA
ncbi:hypothetical protein Ahy_B04g069576 [Arachis hypogaea]|uniref:Endonuclease/exonuclease/phosphatase domain-containing protein n=1 Tax=Arachis hypogaea TaxID=3818 RepID=A0A444ZD02_ARAHY|nr:hypothetical protein Ahy_B04g069576 [Arachis hypogaea]